MKSSRRVFIQKIAAATVATPYITRSALAQAPSTENVIRHASFGCNGMALADVQQLASHKAVKVVAGCDVDERRTAEFRKAFPDAQSFQSSAALLENVTDIVAVCVRGPHHFAVTKEVIAAGPKVIFLEKPPTCSLAEMDELRSLAQAKNVPIVVSYSRHWAPHILHLQKLVEEGLIGQVKSVIGYCGGGILSFASHTTDLICQFAGYEATAVTAKAHVPEANEKNFHNGHEIEPALERMIIEFQNGVCVTRIIVCRY